jgi:thiol:disulfide interchange protein
MNLPRLPRRRLLAIASALPFWAWAAEAASPLPVDFDPARDPAKDLEVALRIAHAANRRVVIEVGGDWCSWCHILDRFFEANPDLKRYRDANYIWLKVNWSPENKNEAFLRRYPAIPGYPHFFVLEANGRLAGSQNTSELEAKKTYDPAAMHAFLVKWAPKR